MNLEELTQAFETSIGSHGERWRHCEGMPESTLLRLAILRDIARELHAQKSRCLANGRKDLGQAVKTWEARIEQLRSASRLDGELAALASGQTESRKRTRLIPEALFAVIEREKFERYDRTWEAALASEGAAQGWRFWTLEGWVEVARAEEWNHRLTEQLWPSGLVLFVEASSLSGNEPPTDSPIWKGRWMCMIHSRFRDPHELTLHASSWPGAAAQAPSAPQWKLLFSPKGNE